MKHRNAAALLRSAKFMLEACLNEHRCKDVDFNRAAWAQILDLIDSPLFVMACGRLEREREEDRLLEAELNKLLEDVIPVLAQAEVDMPPEEVWNRLHETYPLFPEAELKAEVEAPKRIHNEVLAESALAKKTTCANSARTKPPKEDPSVRVNRHIVEMLKNFFAAGRTVQISGTAANYEASVTAPFKTSSAKTLEGCIEGLTDHPRMRICIREDCNSKGCPKPLWTFAADADGKDGHSNVCHECESRRITNRGKSK